MITTKDLLDLVELAKLAVSAPSDGANQKLQKKLSSLSQEVPVWYVGYMDRTGHECEQQFTGKNAEEEARIFAKQWQQCIVFYRINGGTQRVVY